MSHAPIIIQFNHVEYTATYHPAKYFGGGMRVALWAYEVKRLYYGRWELGGGGPLGQDLRPDDAFKALAEMVLREAHIYQ